VKTDSVKTALIGIEHYLDFHNPPVDALPFDRCWLWLRVQVRLRSTDTVKQAKQQDDLQITLVVPRTTTCTYVRSKSGMGGGAIHTEHILNTNFVGHEITGCVGTFELLRTTSTG
jgi:hypothetical protein